MYNLYDLGSTWKFESQYGTKIGTFDQIVRLMVTDFGIDIEEIEAAVDELFKMNHQKAHFGVLRTFMYTEEEGSNARRVKF